MTEKVKELVDASIRDLGLFVFDASICKVEGITNLCITLDSEEVIDLDLITEASRIVNPIMDEADLVDGEYVLDISSKEKGDSSYE